MIERMKEIYAYRDMVRSLVRRELRGKYKGSFLGFLWTFINPLCQMVVYMIVFSVIVKTNLNKYYVYMIVGIMPWFFFDLSLRQGAGCVRYQGDMIKKIYFPREVLPIACVTANFVNMLLCDIIVLAVIFVSGIGINLRVWIYIPFVWLIEYMLALGFALIISAGTVYFNDLEHITTVILMAWIYGTPIMYTIDQIPQSVRWIFQANPMTPIIEAYHHILYWGDTPSRYGLLYAFLFALIILLLGEITFMTLEENFAEEL